MKKLLLFVVVAIMTFSCVNKSEQQAMKSGVEIFFDKSTYDYGQIDQGSDGLYKIKFKNIGEESIIINKVRSSCGCTVPSWPKEPVEPGNSGTIEVKYNTALAGSFMKSIIVYSSAANSPVKLVIKGKVIEEVKENS